MAVQAGHLAHAFRPADDATMFLDDFTRCGPPVAAAPGMVPDTTRLREFPRSDLTCNHYSGFEFEPRKRARADAFSEDRRVALPPVPASTSGRAAGGSGGGLVLSRLYSPDDEIDALIRLQSERMRLGLEDARRRQVRALLAAAERAASGWLRAAEAELDRALRRNAELEDRARQAAAECQAWMGVARSHEAVAARLRATLDQLLLQQPVAGNLPAGDADAEDAQSCCFETASAGTDADDAVSARRAAAFCRACRGAEACVLVLPCRHLCLCRACEAVATTCPVCAATKNASLQVLLS